MHIADYPHHIIQRGHNLATCFFAEENYQAYLHWLGDGLQKNGIQLHAYVLMTNHVHLLLTPRAPEDISRLIIALGRQFVQYINKTYRRTGTLWDSRYKSSLIQTDIYLLRCQRYIELNPVRANMVRDPGEYAWSSYRANGLGASDPLLSPHALYLALGETPEARQTAYRELFRTELDEAALTELRLAIQQSQPIGSERFLQQIEQMTGQRREARPRGRPRLEPDGPAALPGQMELGL
ncbi:putative transposase [Allochromatium warmingii]|uniref:Putative transposase n=1 Tax=Allochromatium warmingii TaxID=61595 RepID=A0A1H3I089_ALLWA|nr:transposase [Allochromatium warmingii]SDY20498.1 putative transposase [Allochromatium warmingii]